MDDVAILIATSGDLLVTDVHAGRNTGDGGDSGPMHPGSSSIGWGACFKTKKMAKERLRLPTRMKGGDVKRATDKRYPAFLGALLDVLPRLIDRKDDNGEVTVGVYTRQMTHIIGEGAYDAEGHMNTQFLELA
jgi:hypothetical protein